MSENERVTIFAVSADAGRLPNAIAAPGSRSEPGLAEDGRDDSGATEEPINILLVDDEAKNLTVLESVLADPQYRLVRAESAAQAAALSGNAISVGDIEQARVQGEKTTFFDDSPQAQPGFDDLTAIDDDADE